MEGRILQDEFFRLHLKEGVEKSSDAEYTDQEWDDFASHLAYVKHGYTLEDLTYLNQFLNDWQGKGGNRMFDLATPPDAFPNIIELLGKSNKQRGTGLAACGHRKAVRHHLGLLKS